MKVIFRVDASSEIGTGHVMRCLTLAARMRRASAEVSFISDDKPGNLNAALQDAQFVVQPPGSTLPTRVDWLVVDHYGLDRAYESEMRAHACKILVIDDLANRTHDCDLLVDQNLYDDMETRYLKRVPPRAKCLTGPRFALLRSEFAGARRSVSRRVELGRILVSFGGGDHTNETLKALQALRAVGRSDIRVDVLVGPSNTHHGDLSALANAMPNVTLLSATERMSSLMLSADLMIGAGGTTTWERCCLGLPAIVIAVADNQVAICETLHRHGYQRYLGRYEGVGVPMIVAAIDASLDDIAGTVAMGMRGMNLVDGTGADRVLDAMQCA